MTPLTINICKTEDRTTFIESLNTCNLSKVPATTPVWTPLEFIIKDSKDLELGSVLGAIKDWNSLNVKTLWVKEAHRRQGIGTPLLNHIKSKAKAKGAHTVMVDTFDVQTEKFYLKNDYQLIDEINHFLKGHRKIYFSKTLNE